MTDIKDIRGFCSEPISPDLLMPRVPKSQINPAEWMYERLAKSILKFEEKLDNKHEIGARLVSFGHAEIIHIDDLGYWGPDIIKFYGTNLDGQPVELIQHLSQLNVLLVAVEKEGKEPRRIGFDLTQKYKDE